MLKVRNGFFETNSSSTHSLIINGPVDKQKVLYGVSEGEYGWDYNRYTSPNDIASYMFTLFMEYAEEDKKEEFFEKMETLTGQNREEMFNIQTAEEREKSYYYIDHQSVPVRDYDEILENLDTIIFGHSEVTTNNDNH